MVTITYDQECDAWYIYLESEPNSEQQATVERTVPIPSTGRMINVDYNKDGKPIGIEII